MPWVKSFKHQIFDLSQSISILTAYMIRSSKKSVEALGFLKNNLPFYVPDAVYVRLLFLQVQREIISMKINVMLVVVIYLLSLSYSSFASDAAAGKAMAEVMCRKCHGSEGVDRVNPLWPNLKGQKAAYMAKQLKAFKSGERKDKAMNAIAGALHDADMENLAEYFSSLK